MVSSTGPVQYGGPGLSCVSITSAWPPASVACTSSSRITSVGHQSTPSVSRVSVDRPGTAERDERPATHLPAMPPRQHRDVVGYVDRLEAAVLVAPAWVRPEPVEAGPVLVVAVDAEESKLVLGADGLDGGQVLLGVCAHAEPKVAQLAGHVHVAALSQGPEPADRPVEVALQVAHEADDHGPDHASEFAELVSDG